MSDVDRLLAAYRAEVEPTAAELAAVRRAVIDPDAQFRIVPPRRRARPRPRKAWPAVVGAAVGIAAAVVLVWWIAAAGRATAVTGSNVPSQAPDRSVPSSASGSVAEPPSSAGRARPPSTTAEDRQGSSIDAPAPPPPARPAAGAGEREPASKRSSPTRSRSAGPAHAPEEPARDRLERETALIRQAEAALRRDDPAAALAHVDEHARAFPEGALVVERRALRATALCMRGDRVQGRGEATLLQRLPASAPYRERMRRACEGP